MFHMSDSSWEFLGQNYPDLLMETNLRLFLLKLDEFITEYGLDDDDNMTDFGHEAQCVYDDVYMCNN